MTKEDIRCQKKGKSPQALVRALYIVVDHNTTVCIIGLVHRAVLNHGHEWSVQTPGREG